MFKKFLKEYWPDIVFGGFALLTIIFFFVPSFNIVFETAEGVESTLSCSIFDFLNGRNDSIKFGPNYVLIAYAFILLVSFLLYYFGIVKKEKKPIVSMVSFSIAFAFIFISIFALLFLNRYTIYFNEGLKDTLNYKKIVPITYSYGIYLISLIGLEFILIRRLFDKMNFTVYDMSEMAILCALALVLDKIKIPVGATGGSINASAVPLFIIAIRFGFLKGIISSSVIFGVISCMLDGYGFQFYPFDYLIAFSGYAFVGLIYHQFLKTTRGITDKNKRDNKELLYLNLSFVIGGVISWLTRMTGHMISSIVYYGLDFSGAFIYNVIYVSFSVLGSVIIACALSKPIEIIMHKYPLHERVTIED